MRLCFSELRKGKEHCFHSQWGRSSTVSLTVGETTQLEAFQRQLRARAANILLNFPIWLMQYRQSIFVCVFLVNYVTLDQSQSSFGATPPTYMARVVTADVMESGIPTKGCPRSDNTVLYRLFPSTEDAGQDELTHYAVRCTELASRLTTGHVWHYEPFRVGAWQSQRKGMHGMCLFISASSHVPWQAQLVSSLPRNQILSLCWSNRGAIQGEHLNEYRELVACPAAPWEAGQL